MADHRRHEHKPGIYFGAAISAMCLLIPFIGQLVVPAYLLGPLAATWLELRGRGALLDFKDGALLGFYSTFYGALGALAVSRIASEFFREQLWRWQNIYRLPPLLASKGFDANSASGWYVLLAEIAVIAIIAGILGTPAGLLGVRLFRARGTS
jgi:hypothetical protein